MKYGLSPDDLEKIKGVFKNFPLIGEVVLYGSRALGAQKPGSDIDIALKGNLTFSILLRIENQLEELNLPYYFDILLYKDLKEKDLIQHIDQYGQSLLD